MSELLINLLYLGLVCLVVLGIYVVLSRHSERTARRHQLWAEGREWHFIGKERAHAESFTVFPFTRDNLGSHAIAEGTFNGIPVTTGVHEFSRRAGRNNVVSSHPWVMTSTPAWPNLHISRRGTGARASDISLEWGEFNKLWSVGGRDRRFTYRVVSQQMMELLQTELRERSLIFESGLILVTTHKSMAEKPAVVRVLEKIIRALGGRPTNDALYYDDHSAMIDGLCEDLTKVMRLLPRQLWTDEHWTPPLINHDGVSPRVSQ
ncbi:MAG: hypothetical protein Q4P23_12680 [Micrococcaceae bacterium]|nr:hypothetical protein [Micrococcaceae bacterium]